ncbi:MAG: hypothetical protein RLZ25_351 [Pseudomonadota bacterium]|jgi:wyosine [tRNA(Phe)-imidazoG37] synthetase (radical SAM superfamily)
MSRLTHDNHDRDSAGLTYVYPVLSRRSRGLSIGINLNTNNACNWACLYCQVPGLTRGSAPRVDTEKLKVELRSLLDAHRSGALSEQFELGKEEATLRDIAISGNGEPTSCPNFSAVTQAIGQVADEFQLSGQIKFVLITNGSLMDRREVQEGLKHWGQLGGEAWFKVDRGSSEGIDQLNQVHIPMARVRRNLAICLEFLPTWIQTCIVTVDGSPPSNSDTEGYIGLLEGLRQSGTLLKGVLLYGLARPSMQPDAKRLGSISPDWSNQLVQRISAMGLEVRLNP